MLSSDFYQLYNTLEKQRCDYIEHNIRHYKYDIGWQQHTQVVALSGGCWDNGEPRQAGRTTYALTLAFQKAFNKENVIYFVPNSGMKSYVADILFNLNVGCHVPDLFVSYKQNELVFSTGGSIKIRSLNIRQLEYYFRGLDGCVFFDHTAWKQEGYFCIINGIF